MGLLAKKDLKGSRDWLDSPARTGLLVIRGKRVPPERKACLVILDLPERSATLDRAESKEQTESAGLKVAKERREKMDSPASKVTWV